MFEFLLLLWFVKPLMISRCISPPPSTTLISKMICIFHDLQFNCFFNFKSGKHMLCQATEPLSTFLEYITYDLDDMNIEIMRNTLYKAYIEYFCKFCQDFNTKERWHFFFNMDYATFFHFPTCATTEIMSDLLAFEANRRVVNITINSIELMRDDRRKLYSNFGLLYAYSLWLGYASLFCVLVLYLKCYFMLNSYPYGHKELVVREDIDQVCATMEKYPPYLSIFSKLSYLESQMLDKAFYKKEFHNGVLVAYMTLREQEIRNLMWISECMAQNQKSRIRVVFTVFLPFERATLT
ncbi:hypothetical protein CXB51_003095 [Gossypium anomalum]|uniref:Uncharacterized protein n=1 Tax=Gossypium anomalum TaxID=47600 RepID=A0A8J5ZP97_9ROSI|nr:hypothetical protein CXB51_003095 [Gossypium anomalum]